MSQIITNATEIESLNAPYIDTPRGLYAPKSGTQFQTSEVQLHAEVPDLMQKVSLGAIISDTEMLLKAPQTLALILLPILVTIGGLVRLYPLGLVLAVAAFYFYAVNGAKWASVGSAKFFGFLQKPWLIWGLNLLGIGNLLKWWWDHRAQTGEIGVWEGVIVIAVGFVLLNFGVIEKLMVSILEKQRAKKFTLPVAEYIFRKLLSHEAKKHDETLPESLEAK